MSLHQITGKEVDLTMAPPTPNLPHQLGNGMPGRIGIKGSAEPDVTHQRQNKLTHFATGTPWNLICLKTTAASGKMQSMNFASLPRHWGAKSYQQFVEWSASKRCLGFQTPGGFSVWFCMYIDLFTIHCKLATSCFCGLGLVPSSPWHHVSQCTVSERCFFSGKQRGQSNVASSPACFGLSSLIQSRNLTLIRCWLIGALQMQLQINQQNQWIRHIPATMFKGLQLELREFLWRVGCIFWRL